MLELRAIRESSMNRAFFMLAVSAAALVAACNKVDSDNVKTEGLYASYAVEGNNQNSATCRATFRVAGPEGAVVDLKRQDKVSCNGLEMLRTVSREGVVSYQADVAFNPGGQYKITLKRPAENLYESIVELPPTIARMNPGEAFAVPKGSALSPSWQPSASGLDEMTVEISFRYSDGLNEKAAGPSAQVDPSPERGVVAFGAGDTSLRPQPAGVWNGSLIYRRSRHGMVAAGLNGLMTGSQTAVVPMQLTD